DRRVLHLELVGVRGPRRIVIGIAIADVRSQVIGSGLAVGDRQAQLREPFVDLVALVDIDQRARKAGQIAGRLGAIWVERDAVHAVFKAEVDGGAIVCPRSPQPVLAQFASDVYVFDLLGVVAIRGTRRRE